MQSLLKGMLHDENAEPTDLPITLLKAITKDFSDDLQIGNGGFAVVYKGLLGDGRTVAVKKLSNSIDMDENKYNQEVGCLMRVKHKNIVRFLGYCADTQGKMCDYGAKFVMADVRERLLCFEYLPKGSLEQYICDASGGLKWRKRYQIIKGICEGLHHLHGKRIVHLDLKPANILLDDDMMPKISDFGLSRCFDENKSRAITSKLVGSLGYLAPEFYRGVITTKLDIYSLGVIIIEVLTGQKGYTPVESIHESWRNTLNTSSTEILLKQVNICAEMGIECIAPNPEKRPDIQHILQMLIETESMDEFIKTGMSTISTTQVKLETMTRNKSIPWTMACSEFPVLVRVTAPPRCTESSRVGVDLVAVLDIGESMKRWDSLEKMKQAMVFVIDSLGPDDRLSVVAFNSQVHRCTELSEMTDVNRQVARTEVLQLTAAGQGIGMDAAIQEAAKILGQRGEEERSSRAGRIILVTNGEDMNASVVGEHISHEFPVQTIGLGLEHKSYILHDIADQTSGVYSYVIKDIDVALAQCIGGLTSVAAMDVEVNFETFSGVTISSIDSGGYTAAISLDDGRRSSTVHVRDLYAGEQKSFIVWLSVPAEGTKYLMSVSGSYRNPRLSKEAAIQLESSEVVVRRPAAAAAPTEEITACLEPEVAAEVVRIRLVKGVSDMRKTIFSLDVLQELWDAIRVSEEWGAAPEATMLGLARDVEEMKQGFYSRSRPGPVPFLFSWMSSQRWQRAATRDSPSKSGAFRTAAMEEMLRRLFYPSLRAQTRRSE